MKKYIALLIVLGLTGSIALAYLAPWNAEKQPPISLPEAYTLATHALGGATNEFYCVGANSQVSRFEGGEWVFVFSTTNGNHKFIFIPMDKRVKLQVFDNLPPA
jgi:hypothetical protein